MKAKSSIVHNWSDLRIGSDNRRNESLLTQMVINSSFLSNLIPTQSYEHILNKMLSSLEWHPKYNTLLVGSRRGDVLYVDISSRTFRQCVSGRGRGQQVTAIKFDSLDNQWFYTSSTSGKLMKHRLDCSEEIVLKDSYDDEALFYSRYLPLFFTSKLP